MRALLERAVVKGAAAGGAALLAITLSAGAADAKTPRDYFLNPPPDGTDILLDAYTIGGQLSLENRAHLEEGMSMLYSRASAIYSYPFKEGTLNLDLRVFLFTLGASVGIRDVHRDHTLIPGEDFDGDGSPDSAADNTRDARNTRESEGLHGSQTFPFWEGRFRLTVPLDSFFLMQTVTVRGEDRNDNSFDWFHAFPHDGGVLVRSDTTLFFRHRDFGAIGPALRYIDAPKEGGRAGRINYGISYGTRPGLSKTDLFLVQTLFQFGEEEFGLHGYNIPWYLLAVYRTAFAL
ncbi:MAG: hypothetical protein KIT72_04880 [Polyangiaceae bacterium]|nr:hypothetical protein [Polyangiaceae bacterium]MCW5789738.1 hypothetical protein [Polyangiaceae bacterium]